MKILPFKIPKPENGALYIQEDIGKTFYGKLHQHQEFQISCILEGEGTYIIGDCVGSFKPNDIFMLGENLPHVFKSDLFIKKEPTMISLFFSKHSYGEHFFELPEFEHFQKIFSAASLGFEVKTNKISISKLVLGLSKLSKFRQFTTFIEILNLIASSEISTLSSLINLKKYDRNEGKRMSTIFKYTMDNFQKEIPLHEISEIANMTSNAFCRYFKQRTNKTFINFLIDIRIGNACQLLTKNNELNITEISYKSGFNNLANFNRKFKAIKGVTPSEYRKKHM